MRLAVSLLLLLLVLAVAPAAAQDAGTPAPPASWPNDIPCGRIEAPVWHVHARVSIYVNGEPQTVPYGIGIGQPWETVPTDRGPSVSRGSCYSWLHTHTADGIIHVEPTLPRTLTLGDFFAVWGQPLGETRVGQAEGRVFAYVDGVRLQGSPADIPLAEWRVIQLNVGVDSPAPQPFLFPSPCC